MLVLTPADLIDALASAFRRHAAGSFHVPPRSGVAVSREGLPRPRRAVDRGTGPETAGLGTKIDGGTGVAVALLEGTVLAGLPAGQRPPWPRSCRASA